MAISADDDLSRVVKTPYHIVQVEGGGYGVSPQLWTSMRGGCSVELLSMLEAADLSVDDRIGSQKGIGASTIGVFAVRNTMNRVDPKTKEGFEPLGVAYTPIAPDQPFGPNPFHCDIFPKLGKPGTNLLYGNASLVRLDQNEAKSLWEQRHGITPAGEG